jgi:hypothetical protein
MTYFESDSQDEVSDPHGEERVFPAALALAGARLRTMLRIALRPMRPQEHRQRFEKTGNAIEMNAR